MKEIVNRILDKVSDDIPSEVVYWDGEKVKFGKGDPEFQLIIKTPDAVDDIVREPSLGFGENYMNGNIVVNGNLQSLLSLEYKTEVSKIKPPINIVAKALINNIKTLNSKHKAKKNISHHYDLGNDFYKLMLDKTMTYSCAYFKDKDDTLENAQNNKYELICKKLRLKDGDRLVDIGCGWGGMLIYAAKRFDIKAVGCTLAKHQYEYAKEKIKQEGLEDRVKVFLKDYRDLEGKFNKFVSIGMFEHVGRNYALTFFRKVSNLLEDKSLGLLHTIARNRYYPTDPWTKKYIFPGGYIPVLYHILRDMSYKNLYVINIDNLRPHYAKTLDEWIKRFESNVDKVRDMFGDNFINMWRLYLNGASAGFKYGITNVYQILFSNNLVDNIPLNKDW